MRVSNSNIRTNSSTLARATHPILFGLTLAAMSCVSRESMADDIVYSLTPTDTDFSGINWAPGTTPTAAPTQAAGLTDFLYFGGAPTISSLPIGPLNNDLTNAAFTGITFNADAVAFMINGNAFTLNGSLTNNSASLQTIATDIVLTAVQTVGTGNATNAGNVALTGVVSGVGGITKAGPGTLTLSGTNTYTGVTTLNAGTLNAATLANGGSNSAIGASSNAATNLVFGGGTLQYTGATAQSTDRLFTIGSTATIDGSGSTAAGTVTFSNGGSIAFANSTAHTLTLTGTNTGNLTALPAPIYNTIAAVIGDQGTGNATSVVKNGPGTWALTNANTYTGTTTINAGSLLAKRTTEVALGTGTVTVASGANVTIVDHAGGGQLAYANAFNLTGTGINGGGALRFFNSGGFGVTGPVSISGGTTIATDPVTQSTTSLINFSTAAIISGSGGLNLVSQGSAAAGTPQIRLDAANIYTGDTRLTSSGVNTTPFTVTLQGTSANRLPVTTNLIFGGTPTGATGTFDKSVTLALNNTAQTVAGLSTANTPAAGQAYRIVGVNANTAVFVVANATANTYNGSFGGTGTNNNNIQLNKTGAGLLTLGGDSSYAGTGNTLANGKVNGYGTVIGVVTTGVVTTGGAATADTTTGSIRATNGNAFGTAGILLASTSSSAVSGVQLQGGISVPAVNTLSVTTGRGVSLSTASTSPILRSIDGDNTFAGAVNILAGGGGAYIQSDANTLTLSGNLNSGNAASIYGFNGPGNITVTGNITTTTAGQITKLGGGLLTLSGANTYTGTTTIGNTLSDGTAVRATSNGALGSGAGTVLINAGTGSGLTPSLQLAGGITLANPITATLRNIANATPEILNVSGDNTLTGNITSSAPSGGNGYNIQSDSGTLSLNGNLTYANNATYVFQGAGNITVNGSLATATTGGTNKTGAGTLTFNGTNVYAGNTNLSGGKIIVGTGGTTGTLGTGPVVTSSGTNLTFNRSDVVAVPNVISGAGTVAQAGTGTTALSGGNLYSSGTTISAGTLRADNGTPASGSSLGSGPVAVNAIGTLGGVGRTGAGVVTLNAGATTAGGTITAGTGTTATDTPGKLGSGDQVWKGGAALAATPTTKGGRFLVKFRDSTAGVPNGTATAQVGGTAGTWDQLAMGALDLTNLSVSNKFNLVIIKFTGGTFDTSTSQSYVLATTTNIFTSAAATGSGVAANTPLTDLFALDTSGLGIPDSTPFTVSSGASGDDLVLTYQAAPEPTTAALIGLSGSVLLGRRRRKCMA